MSNDCTCFGPFPGVDYHSVKPQHLGNATHEIWVAVSAPLSRGIGSGHTHGESMCECKHWPPPALSPSTRGQASASWKHRFPLPKRNLVRPITDVALIAVYFIWMSFSCCHIAAARQRAYVWDGNEQNMLILRTLNSLDLVRCPQNSLPFWLLQSGSATFLVCFLSLLRVYLWTIFKTSIISTSLCLLVKLGTSPSSWRVLFPGSTRISHSTALDFVALQKLWFSQIEGLCQPCMGQISWCYFLTGSDDGYFLVIKHFLIKVHALWFFQIYTIAHLIGYSTM